MLISLVIMTVVLLGFFCLQIVQVHTGRSYFLPEDLPWVAGLNFHISCTGRDSCIAESPRASIAEYYAYYEDIYVMFHVEHLTF